MKSFEAILEIIVGNPFVFVPDKILAHLFQKAQKNRGPIPVHGKINGKSFRQTLVKYSGHWRLYINMKMLKNSPKRIGEKIKVDIAYDPSDRTIPMHPKLKESLDNHIAAKEVFETLAPSRQKEIIRYIAHLKSEESVDRNITRAINFLLGHGRFVGRDKP